MAARAFQIQVRGLLDGATALVVPSPLPTPVGGVTKIDAGVGVNVGSIDLCALFGTSSPLWLRSFQVEYAALTLAARMDLDISGSRQKERLIEDLAGAPVLMPLITFSPRVVVPAGGLLEILTDDTDATFTGLPVAGPHFLYFELDALSSDAAVVVAEDLQREASSSLDGARQELISQQAAAASGTDVLGAIITQDPYSGSVGDIARVESIDLTIGDAAAAGESMQIDVVRVRNGSGATTTIATVTVNDTFAADTRVAVATDPLTNILNAGDRLQVVRTYVAGMAPTPLTNTNLVIRTAPALLRPLPA